MKIPIAFAAVALSLCAAQTDEVWSAGELKSTADKLSAEALAKGIAGKPLGASAALWRRAKSGEAELHKTKTDLIVIEEGFATLVTGGAILDPRSTAPNELRGASIRGGESRRLAPGDIVRIPAGTPHQFLLDKGEHVAYFAVKIPAR